MRLLLCLFITMVGIPQVTLAIGNLDTTDIIWQKEGKDSTSKFGGRIGDLGDINGDGYSDIGIFTSDTGGIQIYHGGNPPDTNADGFLQGFMAFGPAGDLTGDGIDDIITVAYTDSASYWQGRMYFYQGFGDSLGSLPYDSIVPPKPNHGFGTMWTSAYVDSDSLADLLVVIQDPNSIPRVCLYSGGPVRDTFPEWSYQLPSPFPKVSHHISGLALSDFTGDGALDICLGFKANFSYAGYVAIFAGPEYGQIPDLVFGYPLDVEPDFLDSTDFAVNLYDVGDLDGDSFADLGVNYGGDLLIYTGGPAVDTLYDYMMQYGVIEVVVGGDLNADGSPDLVCNGISTSAYRSVDVYLGGVAFDTVMDDEMLRSDLPPWFLTRIGFHVSPAGDFDGDGTDDFMFSCQNFLEGYRGAVFVVGGTADIVTDVEEETGDLLPDGFELHQNYPNPFNPSTTISFSLPHAETVTLRILNPLGQTVATLIDSQRLGPGEHAVVWEAEAYASGVYLYELDYPTGTLSRKMLLVK